MKLKIFINSHEQKTEYNKYNIMCVSFKKLEVGVFPKLASIILLVLNKKFINNYFF